MKITKKYVLKKNLFAYNELKSEKQYARLLLRIFIK